MPKIRSKAQSTTINKAITSEKQGCSSDQHPYFSFRYMTANKQYSLSYLESLQGPARENTLKMLYERLAELSCHPWLYWTQQPKNIGLETIKYDQLHFEPQNNTELTKDSTLYIFRFDTYQGHGKGRIIGFKSAPCSVFQIIGYDFDFSAYSHG